jgi:hypothetical protein
MSTPQLTADTAQMRQSWVQLGGLIILILLITSLVSLFALWSQERAHARYDQDLLETTRTIDTARHAEVHFKTQVQEWKNVLLRHKDPALREEHWARFEREHAATDQDLTQLQSWAGQRGQSQLAERILQITKSHHDLMVRYSDALPAAGSAFDSASVDAKVRGIDRALDAQISKIIEEAIAAEEQRITELRATEATRYGYMRRLVWLSNGIALMLLIILLGRILRNQARAR